MSRIFNSVAVNHPRLNRFDLSYTNTTTMNFGYLYPIQCDEVYPGDVFKMSALCHVEVMPMVAPIMSDIQLFAHTFFVPYRLLFGIDSSDGVPVWEKFITGGKDGDYDTPLPSWSPNWSKSGFTSLSIWDYIGNPVSFNSTTQKWSPVVPANDVYVNPAPKFAYNFIYNSFYADENLEDEIDITSNEDLLLAAFKKDYFTSALEAQQRGTAPALPVDILVSTEPAPFSGTFSESAPVTFAGKTVYNGNVYYGGLAANNGSNVQEDGLYINRATSATGVSSGGISGSVSLNSSISGTVDLSDYISAQATTFNISDLRLAFAIQRLLELNMTGGYRYVEWLNAHYGVHPTDSRLDRPEYIGGALIPIGVNQVIQTSSTGIEGSKPQGTKTAVGSVDTIQKIGNYRVLEHGLIMTIVSIRPKPIYSQGINAQWLRSTRFDYYTPELAYLSEQAIKNAEIYIDGTAGDSTQSDADAGTFGYQARWNELRCKNNMVSGAVRTTFNYWTLDRLFDSRPHLNSDFIKINPDDFNKIFAVQDEDPFVVSWSSIIDAYRPIPAFGTPGLVDHVYGGR